LKNKKISEFWRKIRNYNLNHTSFVFKIVLRIMTKTKI
jgi:hypothetical protein